MKPVKYVFVHTEYCVWNNENNRRLRDESRSLGFFLGLVLKAQKVKAENFDGIFFRGVIEGTKDYFFINNLLVISIYYPESLYPKQGQKKEINEYLISRIEEGMLLIKEDYPEIVTVLNEGIAEFKELDYQCNWIHKKRKVGQYTVQLRCEMDVNAFHLYFDILNKAKALCFSELILETPPNEFSFKYKFKDIKIKDDSIVTITDLSDEEWFRLDIKKLRKLE